MKNKILGTAVATSLLFAVSAGTVMAQDTTATDTDTTADRTVDTDRDEGFDDWGLLGLLGLLGLIPRKRHTVVHHDQPRTTTPGTNR